METKKTATATADNSRPADPLFRELVHHSESVKTECGITALRRLGAMFDTDLIQVSLHRDGTIYIGVASGDRHYTVWHYSDGHFTVENSVDTLAADVEKTCTEINRFDSRYGILVAYGRRRGEGV